LSIGSVVLLPDDYGLGAKSNKIEAPLWYRHHDEHFFNVPAVMANGTVLKEEPEEFRFRLISFNKDSKVIITASHTLKLPIRVLNVNTPPILNGPDAMVVNITALEPGSEDRAEKVLINGIVLQDHDKNVDNVRVDVWSLHGSISLSPNHAHLAKTETCRDRGLQWQCSISLNSMTFVAQPDDVNLILRDLEYSFLSEESTADSIHVRVFDGVDGECLTSDEHGYYVDQFGERFSSVRHGCYEASIVIPLHQWSEAPGETTIPTDPPVSSLREHEESSSSVLGSLTYLMLCATAIASCYFCCRRSNCFSSYYYPSQDAPIYPIDSILAANPEFRMNRIVIEA